MEEFKMEQAVEVRDQSKVVHTQEYMQLQMEEFKEEVHTSPLRSTRDEEHFLDFTVQKRKAIVEIIKNTPLYQDYHSVGSACGYWNKRRASTPVPEDPSINKRGWDRQIRL